MNPTTALITLEAAGLTAPDAIHDLIELSDSIDLFAGHGLEDTSAQLRADLEAGTITPSELHDRMTGLTLEVPLQKRRDVVTDARAGVAAGTKSLLRRHAPSLFEQLQPAFDQTTTAITAAAEPPPPRPRNADNVGTLWPTCTISAESERDVDRLTRLTEARILLNKAGWEEAPAPFVLFVDPGPGDDQARHLQMRNAAALVDAQLDLTRLIEHGIALRLNTPEQAVAVAADLISPRKRKERERAALTLGG